MLINILYIYYFNNIENQQIFNKLMITSFSFYLLLYYMFGNLVILFSVFDAIIFTERKYNILDSKHKLIKLSKNLGTNILNKTKKIVMDNIKLHPEFEKERYKPYTHNLKDTIEQLSDLR